MPRLGLIAIVLFATVTAGPVRAQSPAPATAERIKVLLDNDRVRVSEVRLQPGAKFELPTEANQFAYLITDATLEFARPGHTPYEFQFKAGEATLLPAQSTHAENRGDNEIRAVLVVLKPVSHGKSAGKASGKSRRGKGRRR
jgi:hypothetical protein